MDEASVLCPVCNGEVPLTLVSTDPVVFKTDGYHEHVKLVHRTKSNESCVLCESGVHTRG